MSDDDAIRRRKRRKKKTKKTEPKDNPEVSDGDEQVIFRSKKKKRKKKKKKVKKKEAPQEIELVNMNPSKRTEMDIIEQDSDDSGGNTKISRKLFGTPSESKNDQSSKIHKAHYIPRTWRGKMVFFGSVGLLIAPIASLQVLCLFLSGICFEYNNVLVSSQVASLVVPICLFLVIFAPFGFVVAWQEINSSMENPELSDNSDKKRHEVPGKGFSFSLLFTVLSGMMCVTILVLSIWELASPTGNVYLSWSQLTEQQQILFSNDQEFFDRAKNYYYIVAGLALLNAFFVLLVFVGSLTITLQRISTGKVSRNQLPS